MAPTRRQLLLGALGAAGTAALAGCGPSGEPTPLRPPAKAPNRDDPARYVITPVIAHARGSRLPADAARQVQRVMDLVNEGLAEKGERRIRWGRLSEPFVVAPEPSLMYSGLAEGSIGGVQFEAHNRLSGGVPIDRTDKRFHVFYFGKIDTPREYNEYLTFGLAPDDSAVSTSAMDIPYDGLIEDRSRYSTDRENLEAGPFVTKSRAYVALHEIFHVFGADHVDVSGDLMTATGAGGEDVELDSGGESYWGGDGNSNKRDARRSRYLSLADVDAQQTLEASWLAHVENLGSVAEAPYELDGTFVLEGTHGAVTTSGKGDFAVLDPFFAAWKEHGELGVPTRHPVAIENGGEWRWAQTFTRGKITVASDGSDISVSRNRGINLPGIDIPFL